MGYAGRSSVDSAISAHSHLPLYHEHSPSFSGKLRHVFVKVTRRHLILLAVIISVCFISSARPGLQPDWLPQNVFTCSSSRQQSKHIRPPSEPDQRTLSDLWNQLQSSFTTHGTAPARLVKPQKGGEEEPVEIVRELIKLTDAEARSSKSSHAAVVQEIPPYPAGLFGGAGIVTLAGGPFSEYAATSLGMLREVGSLLPVELWVISPQEEMEGWCDELISEGVACRQLSDYIDVNVLQHPYQYKILTMLLSSFEEILFIDADSMPLRKPDGLFQAEDYLRTGAILWPDYWSSTASPWTPFVLGLSDEKAQLFENVKTAESGQILWNKRRHWRSLVLASYYNFLGPSFYYTLISANYAGWGDKDTFPWALRALGEDYYQTPHDISTVFQVPNSRVPAGHGIGMAQADPRDNSTNMPMFLHNNIIKWSMRGFLCDGCPVLWADVSKPDQEHKAPYGSYFESYYTNRDHSIYENLHENRRILESDTLTRAGLDLEPLIWKAMEYTACRSRVWGNKQVCGLARQHMATAFGFDFRPTPLATATGFGADMCIIDPPGMGYVQSIRTTSSGP